MRHDDDDDLSEYPDSVDTQDVGSADTDVLDPCPHCRRLLYDDSERCPHCGEYVTVRARNVNPWWFVPTAVVCLVITVYLLFR